MARAPLHSTGDATRVDGVAPRTGSGPGPPVPRGRLRRPTPRGLPAPGPRGLPAPGDALAGSGAIRDLAKGSWLAVATALAVPRGRLRRPMPRGLPAPGGARTASGAARGLARGPWLAIATALAVLAACQTQSWEQYMDAAAFAYQDGRTAEAESSPRCAP